MIRLAVASQKGGTAKTTSAVNIAAAWSHAGRRVLLIDLDGQASASAWLNAQTDGRELIDALTGTRDLASIIQPTTVPNLELVPSGQWLTTADRQLAAEPGAETMLRTQLEGLPRSRFDAIVIDTPPALGLLSLNALVAARSVLVPVTAETMPLAGLAALTQTVDRVRARLNRQVAIAAILLCRVDTRRNLTRDVIETLRQRFGRTVLDAMIRENVRLAEAPSHHQAIFDYAPTSSGAEDYRAAADELAARLRS
jgi:chromosome partitioning protein